MNEFAGVVGRTVAESRPDFQLPPTAPPDSPDLLVIVLDDVGFAQLGCFGSTIATPHMDRLAANGLRYANFHTTALCSPTRACLLTGRNHHAVGMSTLANWNTGFPGSRGHVRHETATLAEMLVQAGYNTMALGKWHLTPTDHQTPAGPYDQWPLQRGFERYYGFLGAATSQWHPELTYDNHRIETPTRPGYHLTEDIVDHAVEFVRDQISAAERKPFFLYTAFGACHDPHQAPREFIDRYSGAFDDGWDNCRETWFARQQAMGLVPHGTVLSERNPDVRPWASLGQDERRLYARFQEAFAGMLEHTDHHIGRLLSYLDDVGRLENTLVVLLSDNGASSEGSEVGTLNCVRYSNRVPEDLADNLAHIDEIGGPRGYNNYPTGWAMAGNTPGRWYKQYTHGGGVRDPLIISWRAGIGDTGGTRSQFHHVSDLVPTILEVVGVDAPETYRGVPQLPIHGTSLAYTFTDAGARSRKHVQYFEMLGHRAIWSDGWKAVARHVQGDDFDRDHWELYDLEHDYAETCDLAAEEPVRLDRLIDLWWAEAGRYDVLPLDDRVVERRLAPPVPGSLRDRGTFTLYPGIPHIGPESAPDTRNVSHTIRAEVEPAGSDVEGVLLAFGGYSGGYTLYVKDGRLSYEYNHVGTHVRVSSESPLGPGWTSAEMRFTRSGGTGGAVELVVDDQPVGTGRVPHTMPFLLSLEGMDVGCDRLTPVSDDYRSPFPYNGGLRRVTVALGADRPVVAGGAFAAQLARD